MEFTANCSLTMPDGMEVASASEKIRNRRFHPATDIKRQ